MFEQDPPVLVPALLRDVRTGEDLDAAGQGSHHVQRQVFVVDQHSVLAQPDAELVLLRFNKGGSGAARLEHLCSQFLQQLCTDCGGDIRRVIPRVELHQIRSDHICLD